MFGRLMAGLISVAILCTDLTLTAQEAPAPGVGLANPSIAMGLNGISDWSSQHPFIDIIKTARPWIGHLPDRWGGWSEGDFEAGGYLDEDGWITRMPPEIERAELLVLTDQDELNDSLTGDYILTYDGSGVIRLSGRARRPRVEKDQIRFSYAPGEGPVGILIEDTDPSGSGDYIRNIKLIREAHVDLEEAGAVFNPDWIDVVKDLRALRFMDWMQTNGSLQADWSDRPMVSDYTYARRGVPAEVMIALANEIGADAWFTLPHMASDEYVRNFALMVWGELDPDLKVFVEYSNEMWNFIFAQAHWAVAQAKQRWGEDAPEDAWMQFVGLRASEIARIWTDVFGADAPARLVRVIATHTGWPGLEQSLLQAPLYRAESPENPPPVDAFDAYAITGYFGASLGEERVSRRLLQQLEISRKAAQAKGEAEGLKRVALREFIREHAYDSAIPWAVGMIRKLDFTAYLTETLPYHSGIAAAEDLDLVMYEGGTHVVASGDLIENQDVTDLFVALNYSPEMATLYGELLKGWAAAGGTMFNAFVDVALPGRYGSWGSLRYLGDRNPRHDMIMRFNREIPAWWDARANETFLQGLLVRGSSGDDRLVGTNRRDILLGGAGDDRLVANGRGDRLHGGAGVDTAVLEGTRNDYSFEPATRQGQFLAYGPDRIYLLTDIETIIFSETPGESLELQSLE